jgi:hypothetical protein
MKKNYGAIYGSLVQWNALMVEINKKMVGDLDEHEFNIAMRAMRMRALAFELKEEADHKDCEVVMSHWLKTANCTINITARW